MTIKSEDFGFDNVLLDKKPCKKYFDLRHSMQNFAGSKPLRIGFNVNFTRVYDGIRYLVFSLWKTLHYLQ